MKISSDLQNNIRAYRTVAAQTVGTTGTGRTGKVVDRKGYAGVEFIVNYGAITATNATFTVTIKEGDATGTMTSVADADLIGTEALAGVGATATRTSDVSKNVVKRVGYKGNKRYVQGNIKSTITAATPVSIEAILFNPEAAPATNP